MQGCNQYVTVWNRWRDPNDIQANDVFYRHILPVMCKYKTKVSRLVTESGVVVGNSQQVIIPVSDMYREPSEWREMDADLRRDFFTLQEGDIFALGALLFDITGVTPWRETDVRKRLKPNVFTVKVIFDNTRSRRGKHFKIEGV